MLTTGVDIIEIDRVAAVLARYGDRFLRRVFTPAEIAYCRGRAPNLAARFAAKEAVMKSLGTGFRGVGWRDVEVVRAPSGAPGARLHGRARRRAERLGVTEIAISLSHSRDYALAFAAANRPDTAAPDTDATRQSTAAILWGDAVAPRAAAVPDTPGDTPARFTMPIPVVTVAQMQALEDASERAGVSRDTLMENAGLACAQYIRQQLGGIAGRRILALIGPGNNGADGLVIARRLAQWGAAAHCHIVSTRPDADPKLAAARAAGVTIDYAASDADLSCLATGLTRCDAIIDAILGAGRYRPPQGAIADAINLVNDRRNRSRNRPVFAIDLPTGVHPDTAAVADPTIIADDTLALGCPKSGIAHFPGAGQAGRIAVLDIGLPPSVIDQAGLTTEWMDATLASTLLPPRPPDAHKGAFGHLLIIAGSRHYVGAAALAATAAHRAGAGLVTLATPAGIYPIVAARLTETIHLPLPEDPEGRIAPSAAAVIRARIGAYDALAIGCGMGQSPGAVGFMRQLLQDCAGIAAGASSRTLPIIIDADGLNNLARNDDWPALLRGIPAVLTPHPGEMATLTGRSVPDIQSHRPAVAAQSAARWGQTILLKGAHSIVAAPAAGATPGAVSDSDSDAGARQRILPFANPALAAGGTGDVLTGIIGALLAQGLPPYDAAALGGYLHGTVGEQARRRHGDAGVIASDLPPLLPSIMQDLRTPD